MIILNRYLIVNPYGEHSTITVHKSCLQNISVYYVNDNTPVYHFLARGENIRLPT